MRTWGRYRWLSAAVALVAAAVLVAGASASFAPAPGSPVAVGDQPVGIATEDFDGDGSQDLATANSGSGDVTILLGAGDGTFTEAGGSPVAAGAGAADVAAGLFDGDANVDLAVANSSDDTVTILLGNGDGTFTEEASSPIAVGSAPFSIVAADLDGAGGLDLAVADSGSNAVTILLGNGDGTFTEEGSSPVAAKPRFHLWSAGPRYQTSGRDVGSLAQHFASA